MVAHNEIILFPYSKPCLNRYERSQLGDGARGNGEGGARGAGAEVAAVLEAVESCCGAKDDARVFLKF
ncbi:hypothetical protein F383_00151 [Gossypium arboreum]|uniref:Uncharacterized protein n=1 Tax=Gossypium arboreum TaxID=29729 RepID=A0A0B0PEF1_GOSAR|nr:hypothetical protein F383_00151 [Gossypium arboreum]